MLVDRKKHWILLNLSWNTKMQNGINAPVGYPYLSPPDHFFIHIGSWDDFLVVLVFYSRIMFSLSIQWTTCIFIECFFMFAGQWLLVFSFASSVQELIEVLEYTYPRQDMSYNVLLWPLEHMPVHTSHLLEWPLAQVFQLSRSLFIIFVHLNAYWICC